MSGRVHAGMELRRLVRRLAAIEVGGTLAAERALPASENRACAFNGGQTAHRDERIGEPR